MSLTSGKSCKPFLCAAIATIILGLVFLTTGVIVLALFPSAFQNGVRQAVLFVNGSAALDSFLNPKYDFIWEFHFFNLTNAQRFLSGIDKSPSVSQLGPYRYRELQKKRAVFHENGTIEYQTHSLFNYLPSDGSSSDLDNVSILNVPLLSAYGMLRNGPPPATGSDFFQTVSAALSGLSAEGSAYVSRSVRELLFDGYADPLLEFASKIAPKGGDPIPRRMGFFYGKNDSFADTFLVDKTGRILSWNNRTKLDYWHSTTANMINGSEGAVHHPFVRRDEDLRFFAAAMCRSVRLQYEAEKEFRNLQTYRFALPTDTFSGADDPGFCEKPNAKYFGSENATCLPDGFLNVSACRSNIPIVLSWPQFSFSSPEVKKSVSGLLPDDESFRGTFDVEPSTGLVLRASVQLQLNVAIEPTPDIDVPFPFPPISSLTSAVSPAIVPTLWIRQTSTADKVTSDRLHASMVQIPRAVTGAMSVLVVVGVVLLGAGTVLLVKLVKDGKCAKVANGSASNLRVTYVS